MSLKEKLEVLRNNLNYTLSYSNDYEFNAELLDHSIGDQNIYRLHFMEYYRKTHNYGKNNKKFNVGILDWAFKPLCYLMEWNVMMRLKFYLI